MRSMDPAEQDKFNVEILKCAFISNNRYYNKGLWFSTCRKYDFFSNRVSCFRTSILTIRRWFSRNASKIRNIVNVGFGFVQC